MRKTKVVSLLLAFALILTSVDLPVLAAEENSADSEGIVTETVLEEEEALSDENPEEGVTDRTEDEIREDSVTPEEEETGTSNYHSGTWCGINWHYDTLTNYLYLNGTYDGSIPFTTVTESGDQVSFTYNTPWHDGLNEHSEITTIYASFNWADSCTERSMRGAFAGYDYVTNFTLSLSAAMANVTDVSYMFANCPSLEIYDGNYYSAYASVTTARGMFLNDTSITGVSSEGYNYANAGSMPSNDWVCLKDCSRMFEGCTSLQCWNGSLYYYSAKAGVTNASYMFKNCTSLDFDTAHVRSMNYATNLEGMFYGCSGMTQINKIYAYSAQNVSHMFEGCTALKNLEFAGGGFYSYNSHSYDGKYATVTNADSFLKGCNSLEYVDLSDFMINRLTTAQNFFPTTSAKGFTIVCPYWNDYDGTEANYLAISLPTMSNAWRDAAGNTYTTLPKNQETQIHQQGQITSVASIPTSGTYQGVSWNVDSNGKMTLTGSLTEDLYNYGAADIFDSWAGNSFVNRKVKSVYVNFEIGNSGYVGGLLAAMPNLESVSFGSSFTGSETALKETAYFFAGDTALKQVDLSGLQFSADGADIRGMFYGDTALEKVTWPSAVIYPSEINYVYYGCNSLDVLDLSTMDFSKISDAQYAGEIVVGLTRTSVTVKAPLNLSVNGTIESRWMKDSYSWKDSGGASCSTWKNTNGLTKAIFPQNKSTSVTLIGTLASLKAATGVKLNTTTATLAQGGTLNLTATLSPSGAYGTVAFSSSNTNVATLVSSGNSCTVTAVNTGTATITATVNGKKATCKITVTGPAPAPTADIATGTELSNKTVVHLTDSLSGVTIYYTLDGSDPTTSSSKYSKSITLDANSLGSSITLKAIAVKKGYANSSPATFSYTIPRYTITLEMSKNSADNYTAYAYKGETLAMPSASPSADGYKFLGWYYSNNGNLTEFQFAGDTAPVTVNSDLYVSAQWTEKRVSTPEVYINGSLASDGSSIQGGDIVRFVCEESGVNVKYRFTDSSYGESWSYSNGKSITYSGSKTRLCYYGVKDGYLDGRMNEINLVLVTKTDWTADYQCIAGDTAGYWIGSPNDNTEWNGVTYNGLAQTPEYEVFYGKYKKLAAGTDYTAKFSGNVNASKTNADGSVSDSNKAKLAVSMTGGYSGKLNAYFTIAPMDAEEGVEDGLIEITPITNMVATGKQLKPSVPKIYDLSNGNRTDITKSFKATAYGENIEAGDENNWVELTASGNYTGMLTIPFDIAEAKLSSAKKASIPNMEWKEEGTSADDILDALSAAGLDLLTITANGSTYALEYGEDGDYYFEDDDIVNGDVPGNATLTIHGCGIYSGQTLTLTFKVITSEQSLSKAVILDASGAEVKSLAAVDYTGDSIDIWEEGGYSLAFKTTAKDPSTKQNVTTYETIDSENYTVSYLDSKKTATNLKAGTVNVTLTGSGAYAGGSKKVTGKISPLYLSVTGNATATYTDSVEYVKSASASLEDLTITDKNGNTLTMGKDYKVTYKNANAVSTDSKKATATVTGIGNYSGSRSLIFTVTRKDISQLAANATADPVYVNAASRKAGDFMQKKYTIKDTNGKTLASKDLSSAIKYTNADTGARISASAVVPVGTTVCMTLSGAGSYTGKLSITYQVVDSSCNLAKAKSVTLDQSSYSYTGDAICFTEENVNVKMTANGSQLTEGEDYVIDHFEKNTSVGTAKAVIKGVGEYGGTKTVSFKITKN